MIRQRVLSSNLKSVGYDDTENILEIEFKSGSIYQYFDVPREIYDELMRAQSKGKYFWRWIRDEFEYEKIK